jgi:hypothetical protein
MCSGSNFKNFKKAVSYLHQQLGIRIKTTYKILIQNLKMICYKIQAFQTLSDHECNLLNGHLHVIHGLLRRNPNTSRPHSMPICFTPLCSNAPYQYIPLLNLCPTIFGLMPVAGLFALHFFYFMPTFS